MPRNTNRVVLWCGSLFLAAATVGCQRGPKWNLAPVEGTITKDGQPLANVRVVFWADQEAGTQGPRAGGITDESGHYHLRTDNGEDGAVVGKHRVCLYDRQSPSAKPAAKQRVPSRYANSNETPLRAEVHSGSQILDFDINAAGMSGK